MARDGRAKAQRTPETEQQRLMKLAPSEVPDWFIEWLIEFDALKIQTRLRRYGHVVRSLREVEGTALFIRLWSWAKKKRSKDKAFEMEPTLRWCGNQYAERVVPLLEEFWAKEPGLSTLEETTENVRIQFGKRMRITVLPPIIPIKMSLLDRLDAMIAGEV